jgi:hypothetical protein
MKLNPPKQITFWMSVAIAVVGVVANVLYLVNHGNYQYLQGLAFFLVLVSFVLLCLGLTVKGREGKNKFP